MKKEGLKTTFTVSRYDIDSVYEFEQMLRTMAALGMDVTILNAKAPSELNRLREYKISVVFPDPFDAGISHTRGAGRLTKSSSLAAIKFETDRKFLDWFDDGHTAEEGAAALGVSRSTFYRRLAEYRKRVAERDKANQRRISKGMEPLGDESLEVSRKLHIKGVNYQN